VVTSSVAGVLSPVVERSQAITSSECGNAYECGVGDLKRLQGLTADATICVHRDRHTVLRPDERATANNSGLESAHRVRWAKRLAPAGVAYLILARTGSWRPDDDRQRATQDALSSVFCSSQST
jgi:hypothetical protein